MNEPSIRTEPQPATKRWGALVLAPIALSLPLALTHWWSFGPAWVITSSGLLFAVLGGLMLKPRGLIALSALAAVSGVLTWLFAYGEVAFDNPTSEEITYEIDGGAAQVRVAPQGHVVQRVPAGKRTFTVKSDGRQIDQYTGDVDGNGDHLATTGGDTCYGLFETVYGALSGADAHGDAYLAGKRWYTLDHVDYFFEDPPSSVSSDSSGKAVRKLARATCETNHG